MTCQDDQRGSCFDALPDDVLRRIETSLDVKDRLAFFSCCRAVRAYQKAAPGGLWPELEFRLHSAEHMQALIACLARNRQHLGTLSLTALDLPAEVAQSLGEVLTALVGSSVHTLILHAGSADFHMGGWVFGLPKLESLAVSPARLGASAVDLSPLTRLTSLRLATFVEANIETLPITMPRHLRELHLGYFSAGAFRTCATAAGALQLLQKLELCSPSADWAAVLPWDWLAQLTALTSLTLDSWEGMVALPPQLTALAGLQQLSVQDCSLSAADAALKPLSALTGLTELCVTNNGWEEIPACVFALPVLKELDAKWNGGDAFAEPAAPLAGSSSLTKLTLSAEMALGAARQLVRFPALHTLELASDDTLFEEEERHEVVGQLLGELKKLPRFELLDVGLVVHDAFRRFVEFLRVLNLEYPYEIHTDDD